MTSGQHAGGCHCGAIGFLYRTAVPVDRWSIRACQCSFCRAHGALSTSDSAGTLEFLAQDAAALQRYRFGGRTADFLLCGHCGVYVGALVSATPDAFGIINVRALRQAPAGIAGSVEVRYDGESTAERIARRRQRWTPVTRVL
jgi:hypothetical protein